MVSLAAFSAAESSAEESLKVPERMQIILEDNCQDCHEDGTEKGEVRLDNRWRHAAGQRVSERLTELESEQDGQASDDPFVRLVLDIHHDRAAFIGFSVDGQTVYPGIKEHLLCFPSRFPQHVRETEGMDVADEEFVNNYNEWLARYLEGQLNICKDLQ